MLPADAQQGAATQTLIAHGRAAAYGAGTAYGGNAGGVAAAQYGEGNGNVGHLGLFGFQTGIFQHVWDLRIVSVYKR